MMKQCSYDDKKSSEFKRESRSVWDTDGLNPIRLGNYEKLIGCDIVEFVEDSTKESDVL